MKTDLEKAKDELMEYLKWNKDICWDINNCDRCCSNSKNCGRELKDLIEQVQNQFSNM